MGHIYLAAALAAAGEKKHTMTQIEQHVRTRIRMRGIAIYRRKEEGVQCRDGHDPLLVANRHRQSSRAIPSITSRYAADVDTRNRRRRMHMDD